VLIRAEYDLSRAADFGKSGIVMSSIEDVSASEKKVKEVLGALAKAGAQDQNYLNIRNGIPPPVWKLGFIRYSKS
jgi:hypothetical protein